jgi:hypothetical protein
MFTFRLQDEGQGSLLLSSGTTGKTQTLTPDPTAFNTHPLREHVFSQFSAALMEYLRLGCV